MIVRVCGDTFLEQTRDEDDLGLVVAELAAHGQFEVGVGGDRSREREQFGLDRHPLRRGLCSRAEAELLDACEQIILARPAVIDDGIEQTRGLLVDLRAEDGLDDRLLLYIVRRILRAGATVRLAQQRQQLR